MNKKVGDGVGAPPRKLPRPTGTRDKDEDLMLFRELHKREKDRGVSLLQPVSDEFEANGHYALYGIVPNGKKGHDGVGDSGKNDYDWLKTPPATPLFPSLEMETHGPEFVIQRELPIVQPLSRFSGKLEAENGNNIQQTKSHSLKPKVPLRYSTPTGRPSVSLPEKKNVKSAPVMNQKLSQSYNDLNLDQSPKTKASSSPRSAENKEANWNLLASNVSKTMNIGLQAGSSTKATKPKSRGVSPLVRSQFHAQIAELSDETPPNLRTDRCTSASRSRSTSGQQNNSNSQKRSESVNKTRRQASSPGSTTRGRKQDLEENLGSYNDKTRTQVLGSRMVDRFLNARMSGTDERQSKIKLNASMNEGSDARKSNNIEVRQNKAKLNASLNEPKIKLNASLNQGSDARRSNIELRQSNTKFSTSINESSGFGRLMSKSSLDMALRHMKVQDPPRDAGISHKHGAIAGRRAASVSKRLPTAT